MPQDFAPGLPSKSRFDPIDQSGQTRLVIQRHKARTPHFDMRLHDKDIAHSWVIKSLPGEQTRTLAIRQPTHRASYSDFEGKIESGYGKGTVKKVYDEKVHVIEANDDKIKMVLPEGEFTMLRPKGFKDTDWLMVQNNPIKNPVNYKPNYKVIAEPTDYSDTTKVLQPKVDGAHSIIDLQPDNYNRIYSYRKSKRTGRQIDHSHQVPWLRDLEIPKSLGGTVVRGDLYTTKKGKPVDAEIIGGILNAKLPESLQKQKEIGKLRPWIYDIVKYKGKNVEDSPYADKFKMLKNIESKVPELRVADTAITPTQKRNMVEAIKSGKHSHTKEGVVEWDLGKPFGAPAKVKFRDNYDVYIRNVYPAIKGSTGKEKKEAGGFEYSLTPKGKIVGNVGTGFTQEKRKDMWLHPKDYIGQVARVKSQQQFTSGALRAPAFYTMDVEKNLQKTAENAFIDELNNIVSKFRG